MLPSICSLYVDVAALGQSYLEAITGMARYKSAVPQTPSRRTASPLPPIAEHVPSRGRTLLAPDLEPQDGKPTDTEHAMHFVMDA